MEVKQEKNLQKSLKIINIRNTSSVKVVALEKHYNRRGAVSRC